jgi:hypothetical protein
MPSRAAALKIGEECRIDQLDVDRARSIGFRDLNEEDHRGNVVPEPEGELRRSHWKSMRSPSSKHGRLELVLERHRKDAGF